MPVRVVRRCHPRPVMPDRLARVVWTVIGLSVVWALLTLALS